MTEVIVWSGWIGGIAIGLYSMFQLLVTGKLLGVSTGYANVCSLSSKLPYFHKLKGPEENWRLWFLIGLPLGGLLAALTSPGEIIFSFSMGSLYDTVLPQPLWLKGITLIFGGFLLGFGARHAGGCPSGHSITGMSLLNPPSFLASAGFFVGGILVVQFMFNIIG